MKNFKKSAKCLTRYVQNMVMHRPMLMNLEVTKKCNARCGFCDYWKTTKEDIIDDYLPIVRHFRPVAVTITGGEPLLRNNLERIISDISQDPSSHHLSMITNGSLMDLQRARELFKAGLDSLTFSLDNIGEIHNKGRGLPGNFEHITGIIRSFTPKERQRVIINTFIQLGNLSHMMSLIHLAKDLGVKIGIGTYSDMKTDAKKFWVDKDHLSELEELVEQILEFKRLYPGVVNSSKYFFRNVVPYFRQGGIADCKAGQSFVQITPDGHVKVCSEMPIVAHYTKYPRRPKPVTCTKCWFQCRAESQAPLTISKMKEWYGIGRSIPPPPKEPAIPKADLYPIGKV